MDKKYNTFSFPLPYKLEPCQYYFTLNNLLISLWMYLVNTDILVVSEISGYQGGKYEDGCLLDCCVV
jgi:hypothetical protein